MEKKKYFVGLTDRKQVVYGMSIIISVLFGECMRLEYMNIQLNKDFTKYRSDTEMQALYREKKEADLNITLWNRVIEGQTIRQEHLEKIDSILQKKIKK